MKKGAAWVFRSLLLLNSALVGFVFWRFGQQVGVGYSTLVVISNLYAFFLYGRDKGIAVENRDRATAEHRLRVSESSLRLGSLLGGFSGGFLGQQTYRHKTKKLSFQFGFWLTIIVHVVMVVIVAEMLFPYRPTWS